MHTRPLNFTVLAGFAAFAGLGLEKIFNGLATPQPSAPPVLESSSRPGTDDGFLKRLTAIGQLDKPDSNHIAEARRLCAEASRKSPQIFAQAVAALGDAFFSEHCGVDFLASDKPGPAPLAGIALVHEILQSDEIGAKAKRSIISAHILLNSEGASSSLPASVIQGLVKLSGLDQYDAEFLRKLAAASVGKDTLIASGKSLQGPALIECVQEMGRRGLLSAVREVLNECQDPAVRRELLRSAGSGMAQAIENGADVRMSIEEMLRTADGATDWVDSALTQSPAAALKIMNTTAAFELLPDSGKREVLEEAMLFDPGSCIAHAMQHNSQAPLEWLGKQIGAGRLQTLLGNANCTLPLLQNPEFLQKSLSGAEWSALLRGAGQLGPLKETEEGRKAIQAGSGFSPDDFFAALDDPQSEGLAKAAENLNPEIRSALMINLLENSPESAFRLLESIKTLSGTEAAALIHTAGRQDAATAIRLLKALPREKNENHAARDQALALTGREMIDSRADPETTGELLANLAPGDADAFGSGFFAGWAEKDPVGFSSWLSRQPDTRFRALGAKALLPMIENDPEALRLWSETAQSQPENNNDAQDQR